MAECREVTPNLKQECVCGSSRCTKVGARLNKRGHVYGCRCPRCVGAKNRADGLRAQSVARKALGVPASFGGDTNEERWSDNMFANEVKSGDQCGPVLNWWRKVSAQVLANRADHGDRRRPVRAVAMPRAGDGTGVVVVATDTWDELVKPALEEFYGPEGAA